MRRLPFLAAACLAAALAAQAEARLVGPGVGRSWGKAGVSVEAYRSDAIACAREAAAIDLTGSDPARALVVASRMIDNDPSAGSGPVVDAIGGPAAGADPMASAGSTGSMVRMIGPERQIAKAGDIMHSALDKCLERRGYVPFQLTGAQRKRLARLAPGSDERRLYLHSLASDSKVLAEQAAN